ncbi:seipin-1 [Ricinus communis]|uniref:Seipin n=1 Tax=Ricinus communis TaxID=3988 RepID=B9RM81_RICCO|nr:seipin-1 [Ricinus communis]EEF47404.1 conserved hypothetical protein [Ricinus communis]|eukprot:XP_002514850.1 seipin-1 [Ricinus communis]
MEKKEEEEEGYYSPIPKADWFTKILYFQSDIIYNCVVTLLSPFKLVSSMLYESYRRTEATTEALESTVLKVPTKVTQGSFVLVRKIGLGVMGAIHMFVVLLGVMILAGFLGVGLVQLWVEKPVFLRERLFFDYTDVNPKAVFSFGGVDGSSIYKRGQAGVPAGHSFQVSLELLVPESDYNREVGMFQLTAELLSAKGVVLAKSSQPCMLPFRSLPIRLLRTCLMSIPLVLGISEETRKISIEILKHEEGYPRSKAIRVTLIPRSGTLYVPQLYEAEILMNSQLPWTKQLLRNWKWTISVWATLYIYMTLLIVLLCFCRPLLFPMTMVNFGDHREGDSSIKDSKEPQTEPRDEGEISELVRKWQQRRKKRKAIFFHRDVSATVGSSASSMSITREDASILVEEETGDSESVCLDD